MAGINSIATHFVRRIPCKLSCDSVSMRWFFEKRYYPFGMLMPSRSYTAGTGYRYGFNGKENDNELKGEGNSYDFDARIYDPRISRWLSVDPLQAKFPNETPYLYSGGNPIYFVDPGGKDRIDYYKIITNKGTVQIKVVTEHAFKAEAQSTYGGLPDLVKYNYSVYHTIDLRDGKTNITSSEITDYSSGKWDIGLGEYAQIKLTGKDDGLLIHGPQAVIYGKGTEDPGWGPKADPSKGILSINYGELEDIIGDVMVGMKDYTLKDPKDLVLKVPDLEYKIGKKMAKKIADNDREGSSNTSTSPQTQNSPSGAPYRGKKKGDIVHWEGDPAGSNVRVINASDGQVEFKKPAKDTIKKSNSN